MDEKVTISEIKDQIKGILSGTLDICDSIWLMVDDLDADDPDDDSCECCEALRERLEEVTRSRDEQLEELRRENAALSHIALRFSSERNMRTRALEAIQDVVASALYKPQEGDDQEV